MKQSCPGLEGHTPSQVNFRERLHDKKIDPFARVKSRHFKYNSTRACSACLALTELTRLGEPKCLYREKLARQGG